jgi:hypothetical protein
MSTESTLLGDILFLIPEYYPVRTGIHDLLFSGGLLGIDEHNAIRSSVDGIVGRSLNTRSIPAVEAGKRYVRELDLGIGSPLFFSNLHPVLSVKGLCSGVWRIVISRIFIPARKEAVVTAVTFVNIFR